MCVKVYSQRRKSNSTVPTQWTEGAEKKRKNAEKENI